MSKILDFVPDIVREAAIKGGVENVSVDSFAKGAFGSMPLSLKEAYAKGDYHTIRDSDDKAANDIHPIYQNLREHADKAFFKIHNKSDDRDYHMSISGPRDKPTGYFWTYCPDVPNSKTNSKTNSSQPGGTVGTYSVTSKTLGIANNVWDNKWAQLGGSVLSLVLAKLVGGFIKNRIKGMLTNAAADLAASATGEALVSAGIITGAFWSSVAGAAAGLVVGAVIGIAAYFLAEFIINFVIKDYWVGVRIYNWDQNNTYKVTQYHADNAVWSGGGSFRTIELECGGHTLRMMDGAPARTKDTIYSQADYFLQNDKTFLEGLGVAFRIETQDGKTGFQCAYECPRFKDNRIALLAGLDRPLSSFYDDKSNWAAPGSYSTKSFIPQGNIPVSCTTEALGGRDDHFYRLDVHIGLKPSTEFEAPLPRAPPKPLRPEPEKPRVPRTGEEVTLPNGDVALIQGDYVP
ncbi:hypothetical protein GGS20DRAFT_562462 [Poronia punctata]|nr:hypothetical protein GGS20DRAFT_562462 [Poronia punctata]